MTYPTRPNQTSGDRTVDVLVIGAGAAGLMCAATAGGRGRRVLIVDHNTKVGAKILISGGGRCNFINTGATPRQFVSENDAFCVSALNRYPAEKFIALVKKHRIPFHEKKLGQLFCTGSAREIVALLENECKAGKVETALDTRIRNIEFDESYTVETSRGTIKTRSLVIATGGLSFPMIGASNFGYRVAQQFGHTIVETAPALDGFTFSGPEGELFRSLSGLSVDCALRCNGIEFHESLLFTHKGLSGPAALQASLHWRKGDSIFLNLSPNQDALAWLKLQRQHHKRQKLSNLISAFLPKRLADGFSATVGFADVTFDQVPEKDFGRIAQLLSAWELKPTGTVGYSKAEVTRGGVSTAELSSKTFESTKHPGLYFIGEVVDVTGWLGGYNFHWAWASGWAAGQAV